jgi:hypothetical protein
VRLSSRIGVHVKIAGLVCIFPFASFTHDVGRCINVAIDLAKRRGISTHDGVNAHRTCNHGDPCEYEGAYMFERFDRPAS